MQGKAPTPNQQREVLRLVNMLGETPLAAAKRVGISERSAYKILRRGKVVTNLSASQRPRYLPDPETVWKRAAEIRKHRKQIQPEHDDRP